MTSEDISEYENEVSCRSCMKSSVRWSVVFTSQDQSPWKVRFEIWNIVGAILSKLELKSTTKFIHWVFISIASRFLSMGTAMAWGGYRARVFSEFCGYSKIVRVDSTHVHRMIAVHTISSAVYHVHTAKVKSTTGRKGCTFVQQVSWSRNQLARQPGMNLFGRYCTISSTYVLLPVFTLACSSLSEKLTTNLGLTHA